MNVHDLLQVDRAGDQPQRLATALNVARQLEELKKLQDGWLDGQGLAPSAAGLDWLSQAFDTSYPADLDLPYVYPVAEGGVRFEWTLGSQEVSLNIDLSEHKGDWHVLNVTTDQEETRRLKMTDHAEWDWMIARLRNWSERHV